MASTYYNLVMKPSQLERLKFSRLVRTGADQQIEDLTNDSRKVRERWLYAALPGAHVDGHAFIDDSVNAGSVAILCSKIPASIPDSVAIFQSDRPRLALSELSHLIHGRPSERVTVIGVTGTDGKTSTVYFIYQLLTKLGLRAGFLSSAASDDGNGERANALHQSTPEAPEVHRTLATMIENGMQYAVIESTSHGLSTKTARLAHVNYHAGVLTNMSHEHLEFHGSFDQYRHDKANLFRALDHTGYAYAGEAADRDVAGLDASGTSDAASERDEHKPITIDAIAGQRFAVANADDATLAYFRASTGKPCLTYGTGSASLSAQKIELNATGSRFELHAVGHAPIACEIQVPGLFSVYNALAALGAVAAATGEPIERVAGLLSEVKSVRGRMNVICTAPFSLVVDFAHTPGSFEAILPFFANKTLGKLIVVFGSAGDRDVQKRPVQGRIACEHADVVILANEDPRSEEPTRILEEIASGCTGHSTKPHIELIPPRREAIRRAIALADVGDTVLLLGKGHETSIMGRDNEEPWNEIEVAREELVRAGFEAN